MGFKQTDGAYVEASDGHNIVWQQAVRPLAWSDFGTILRLGGGAASATDVSSAESTDSRRKMVCRTQRRIMCWKSANCNPGSLASSNVLILCPTCHRKMHYAAIGLERIDAGSRVTLDDETMEIQTSWPNGSGTE